MHIYWASVFILPFRVLLNIEQLMRGFLWSPSSLKKGRSKVAWDVVCLPKNEGGLGIRRLEVFSYALLIAHIWKLLSLKESLWVKWIHEYKLKGRSFWDIPLRGNVSWGWRKILQLRPTISEFIWCNLGDGAITSLWFDKWCEMGPLANLISSRDIFRAGLSHTSKPDSHNHLFFECPFASEVWDRMKGLAGLDSSSPNIYAIIIGLIPIASRRSIQCLIAKLVVAASAYYIWQERN
ncbi:hypothetical protein Tco_0434994 [Tanacetum coccineum]